ncbi:MAG: hypothetical protein JWO08_546 [Verrucomicrobiaceae bacterium]|nr:hypothetical protein [Verrucomicrobiaceae bacterium]
MAAFVSDTLRSSAAAVHAKTLEDSTCGLFTRQRSTRTGLNEGTFDFHPRLAMH